MELPPDIERRIDAYQEAPFRFTSGESPQSHLLSDVGAAQYAQSRAQQDLETRVTAGEFGFGRLTTRLPSGATQTVTKSIADNWPNADKIYYWDHWWESDTNRTFDPIVIEDEDGTREIRPNTIKRHPLCPFLLYNFEIGFWWTPSFRQIFRAHITSSQKHAFMNRIMDAYAELALHKGYPKRSTLPDGTEIEHPYPFTSFLKFFGVGMGRPLRATRSTTLPPPRCIMHLMDAHRMMINRWTSYPGYWVPIYERFNDYLDANDLDTHDARDTKLWRQNALQSSEYIFDTFFKNN